MMSGIPIADTDKRNERSQITLVAHQCIVYLSPSVWPTRQECDGTPRGWKDNGHQQQSDSLAPRTQNLIDGQIELFIDGFFKWWFTSLIITGEYTCLFIFCTLKIHCERFELFQSRWQITITGLKLARTYAILKSGWTDADINASNLFSVSSWRWNAKNQFVLRYEVLITFNLLVLRRN
jgi:hypothetical protein